MSAYPVGTKRPEDAIVEVYEPCECSVCTSGDPRKRWFDCPHTGTRWIARYGCTSVVEAVDEGEVFTRDGYPEEANLIAIRAKHPGKVLVHL